MNADDARKLLLVRAFEQPFTAPWTEADAAWSHDEAQRAEGESAPAERLAARRAALAFERLAPREPAVTAALAAERHAAWLWALVPLAFAAGVMVDAIGPSGRLNIVALPLLGIMLWNLAVYLLLAVAAIATWRGAASGRLAALLPDMAARAARRASGPGTAAALGRYATAWAEAGRPLHAARLACVLHAAAAALAAGLLASLYLRGIAFEYRAGWDSTFLDATTVRHLLAAALAPALALTDAVLPSAAQLEALRFSNGPGEPAARWIHAVAISVCFVVLIPRALLMVFAAWRVQRLERGLPLAPALLQAPGRPPLRGTRLALRVLPYNHHVDATQHADLQAALERQLGVPVTLTVAESLPLGSEDALDAYLGSHDDGLPCLPLLSLAATPQSQTNGAFLAALAARQGRRARPADEPQSIDAHGHRLVLIDESAFQRLGDARRAERRAAWQRMLGELGLEPCFTGPSPADGSTTR